MDGRAMSVGGGVEPWMGNEHSTVGLTLDVDWAPDFVIDSVADILIERSVRATWFITHRSPAIDRLESRSDLFELGIHPNLLPGSTHGSTLDEVLDHCDQLLPNARCMRTHGLVQSTWLFVHILARTRIRCDSSLYLPDAPFVRPLEHWWGQRRLIRIPYVWEDDIEMQKPSPSWRPEMVVSATPGLKLFSFHPVLLWLNAADPSPYATLKGRRRWLRDAVLADMADLRQHSEGSGTLFRRLVDGIAQLPRSYRMSDLVDQYERAHPLPPGAIAA